MKYNLLVDEHQLQIIMKALDMYARIQMGQVHELSNPFTFPAAVADYSELDKKLNEVKQIMFPELENSSYYAIHSKKIPDEPRQAVDLIEVIRHQIAWDNLSEEDREKGTHPIGVQYDNPFHWSSEQELAEISQAPQSNTKEIK